MDVGCAVVGRVHITGLAVEIDATASGISYLYLDYLAAAAARHERVHGRVIVNLAVVVHGEIEVRAAVGVEEVLAGGQLIGLSAS